MKIGPCTATLLVALCHCAGHAVPGTQVKMDFKRAGSIYAAPLPSNDMLRSDGTIDLSRYPNPGHIGLVNVAKDIIDQHAKGASTAGAIFMQLTAPPNSDALPSYDTSLLPSSPVFLMSVDKNAPDYQTRYPVEVAFMADGGPFGAPSLLSILPLQGTPLRENTLYAAVVLRTLGDQNGKPLGVSQAMADLASGYRPTGMAQRAYDDYQAALLALGRAKLAAEKIAGIAVFTTDAPTDLFRRTREALLSGPLPTPSAPFAQTAVFDEFCVYETVLAVPVYQEGVPPYLATGGDWPIGPDGLPIFQRTEDANWIVTVPRRPMPAAGYPTVVYVRAGGGGHWPVVDRSPHTMNGGPAIAGQGPAQEFARVGYAAVELDGPLGGRRNVGNLDEQFTIFNILNPMAIRDNIRQSALELSLEANLVHSVEIAASDCPASANGAPPAKVTLDDSRMVMFGHSTGAWMTPLAVAFEPKISALILSGAGGSWIENVVYKLHPVDVPEAAEGLIGYAPDRKITEHDPVTSLVQWAVDVADPQNYARHIISEPPDAPRNVLMVQGIVDHYILPPIANTISLGMGLDLADGALDAVTPEVQVFAPLASRLQFTGGQVLPLPVQGNGKTGVTAIVAQFKEDGIEDGHEVIFQRDEPKSLYRCYLKTLQAGAPLVPVPDATPGFVCP